MAYNRWLAHHGVKGQKWGEKNGPPYPLDRSKSDGHRLLSYGSPQGKKKLRKTKTVFVSGSSKTQDPNSEYYRGELPKDIRLALREHIRNGNKIIVGDAPGIDRQVQDYLKKQKYDNVEIYGPGKEVRYSANPKWKVNLVDDPDHEPGSKEWLAKKDIAMTEAADEGLAIILDDGAKATRNNVRRLLESQKAAKVYSLNKDGTNMWADEKELMSDKVVPKTTTVSRSMAKANKIYDTLSDQEKYFLTAEKNSPRYINPGDYNKKHSSNVYSRIEQYKDVPVSAIDIWQNEDKIGEVSIAVRNGTAYRHKGYASRALENGLKYFYDNPEMEYLVWGVNAKNRPSIELAKKYGFTFFEDVDGEWHTYVKGKEAKHTMAYNRWLSKYYLEHHQVLGAHWGVHNGPPYPLDRSKSDGHKLLKGTGAPQGKKKNRVSENSVRRRASKQGRSEVTDIESAKKKLAELGVDKAGRDEFELWAQEIPEKDRAKWMQDTIDETATKAKKEKLDRADKEGEYELDFLEYVQNEDFYEDYDHKRMLKEYSEYLDDRDAYAQKGLPEAPKTNPIGTMEGAKKQASQIKNEFDEATKWRSAKDQIAYFKDRLLGKKKTEPEPLKSHELPKPVKSEKARTKNGEEYEINDWNGNGDETVREFKRNSEAHIKTARKAALAEARRVIGWYAKNNPEAEKLMNMSDEQLSKRIGLRVATPYSHGTMVFTFGDTNGDLLGHDIDVEYDLTRRKAMQVSVNG